MWGRGSGVREGTSARHGVSDIQSGGEVKSHMEQCRLIEAG